MDPQAWATLKTILVTCGEAPIAGQLPLEPFYEACSRKPLKCSRHTLPLPLKTLLFHHSHLRPEIKAGLEAFVCAQWRLFTSELPSPPPDTASIAAPVAHLSQEVSPPEDQREFQAMPEDWFDRFLNGVRALLFL